jgi:hypothetical protein
MNRRDCLATSLGAVVLSAWSSAAEAGGYQVLGADRGQVEALLAGAEDGVAAKEQGHARDHAREDL